MSTYKNTNNKLLIIGSIFGFLLIAGVLVYLVKIVPNQKAKGWQSFKSFENATKLPFKAPIYNNEFTSGCFKGDAGYGYLHTCSFSSRQFYVLEGGYRENAQQIKSFLKQRGFDFKNENSKYLFESHIDQKNIADDLSNATPLVSDFVNNKEAVEVRLAVGDKKRLIHVGPTGIPSELVNSISEQKLIAILEFSKIYR